MTPPPPRSVSSRVLAKARRALAGNPLSRSLALRRHRRVLTRDFITSPRYHDIMMRHYDPAIDGRDSAEYQTANFQYRHARRKHELGAWRWLGALEHREHIAGFVFDEQLSGVDLGGARGPISPNVDICDRLPADVFGRPVRYGTLEQIAEASLDYVWCSHTLEHIPDLDTFVAALAPCLRRGGRLFAMVPAWTCVRWRAGVHTYADAGGASPHLYTFALAGDAGPERLEHVLRIDSLVGTSLRVELAEMTGDNSILVVATRD